MNSKDKNKIKCIWFDLHVINENIKLQLDKLTTAEDYEDVRKIQQKLTSEEDKLSNLTSDLVELANKLEDEDENNG